MLQQIQSSDENCTHLFSYLFVGDFNCITGPEEKRGEAAFKIDAEVKEFWGFLLLLALWIWGLTAFNLLGAVINTVRQGYGRG